MTRSIEMRAGVVSLLHPRRVSAGLAPGGHAAAAAARRWIPSTPSSWASPRRRASPRCRARSMSAPRCGGTSRTRSMCAAPTTSGSACSSAYSILRVHGRLSARHGGGDSARLPDRHVAADEPCARSVHSDPEADLAARLDAARALHDQGLGTVGDLRHLHLLDLADADQHRVRRRQRAARNGSTSRARWRSARCARRSR